MDFAGKLSFIITLLCILITLKNQNVETMKGPLLQYTQSAGKMEMMLAQNLTILQSLRYDYYNESCPFAERIVRDSIQDLYGMQPSIAPALLRLVFHDCFVGGCDASVLLDRADGIDSEKDSPPNESLKGFDAIDIIKSKLEETCPGVVSCADILVLAARESVLMAGGPFYPLYTGRKDSTAAFRDIATSELPTPQDDHSKAIKAFASRGFSERETVSLLGAHSTGTIHCKFFNDRLQNFNGTGGPDPSIDTEFLILLRSKCSDSGSSSPPSTSASPSFPPSKSLSPLPSFSSVHSLLASLSANVGVRMDYEGPRTGFGMIYYRSLLQSKGLLFVDQQLTAGEGTATWVRAYASDVPLFHRDFARSMIKLSNLQVLTPPNGEVRLNCREVN